MTVISFHPELSGDTRVHERFLADVRAARARAFDRLSAAAEPSRSRRIHASRSDRGLMQARGSWRSRRRACGAGVRRRGRLGRGRAGPGRFDPPARSASATSATWRRLELGLPRGLGGRVGSVDCRRFGAPGSVRFTVRLQRRETNGKLWHTANTATRRYHDLRRRHLLQRQSPPVATRFSAASSPPSCSTLPAAASARTGRCSARRTCPRTAAP